MRLERRIWWTAFIRDSTLALSSSGNLVRPVRIRTDDCDVEMLCLADFDLNEEEGGEEDMRERIQAEACIEKAMVCWCINDISVTNFGSSRNPIQSQTHMSVSQVSPTSLQEMQHESHIYTASYTSSSPLFEDSFSPPSVEDADDPTTPIIFHEPASIMQEEKSVPRSPLGGVFGVDGEYDDYLEYLKLPNGKERERSTWAFQLDCDNDVVLEV